MSNITLIRPTATTVEASEATLYLDATAGVSLAFGEFRLREADYADPDTGALVWIGEDGAVCVQPEQVAHLARVAANAGWHARSGHAVGDFGIDVHTFRPDFHHPAYGLVEAKSLHGTWAVLRETVGADLMDAA